MVSSSSNRKQSKRRFKVGDLVVSNTKALGFYTNADGQFTKNVYADCGTFAIVVEIPMGGEFIALVGSNISSFLERSFDKVEDGR